MKEVFQKIVERLEELDRKTFRISPKDAIEIVNQVAEKCNDGWIPCSERLPENIKTVIMDVKGIRYPTVGWYGNLSGWHLKEEDFVNLKDFTVIAWQPLPEPYKPKGE